MQTVAEKSTTSTAPKNNGLFFGNTVTSTRAFVQPKLTVNEPGDAYEREADAVAEKVLNMHDAPVQAKALPVTHVQRKCAACEEEQKKDIQRKCAHCEEEDKNLQRKEQAPEQNTVLVQDVNTDQHVATAPVQRKCAHCEEEEKKMQRKEESPQTTSADSGLNDYVSNLSGRGHTLPDDVRGYYEPRFGYNFNNVRVHTDTVAAKSAQSINALAYTTGSNIVFNSGQYAPQSDTGKRLLAHELTHVVQQGAGTGAHVQKQEGEESTDTTGTATGSGNAVPDFGTTPPEPGCPREPTRLGDVTPEPPCEQSDTEIDGEQFQFCKSSDVFKDPADANRLVNFVRSQRANATFEVHAYASQESTNTYNINLACYRAKRTARSMINAGVRSERIHIVNKGATTRFGAGWTEAQLQKNRVVLVAPTAQADQPVGELPENRREIVNIARDKLLRGEYRLAADAYISMWTCGTIPSISEAVRRTTILIEDEPNAPQNVTPMGHLMPRGLNTIVLSAEIFSMSNPLECVMGRIIDMSFHHMARPEIPDPNEVHGAALFLVELAGFQPCEQAGTADLPGLPGTGTPATRLWNPPGRDPMAANGRTPSCTATPLAGPQVRGDRSQIGHTAPVFLANVTAPNASGNTIVRMRSGMISMASPSGAMSLNAVITATGNAADFPNYELGFMQTIVANDITIDYVSGHRLNFILPLPIRDGRPSSAGGVEPWFEPAAIATPDASGNATVSLSDSPSQSMSRDYLDVDNSIMEPMILGGSQQQPGQPPSPPVVHRPQFPTQAGNTLNRARKHVVFNTWLVARRTGASLDRYATQFLDGTQITFDMNLDLVGTNTSGTYNVTMDNVTDNTPMQFRNPVPADIRPAEQLTKTDPAPRRPIADRSEELREMRRFSNEVNRIAAPIRTRMGLTDRMEAVIRIDRTTGRIAFNRPGTRAVSVSSPERIIPRDVLDNFADELFFNIRKDSVLNGQLTTINVALPAMSGGTSTPPTFTRLIDRPGIKAKMRDIWSRSVADPLNFREFSITVFMNRSNQQMEYVLREGPPEDQGGGHGVAICYNGDQPLPINISVLGTFHTHPDPDGRQEPSDPDLENVRNNPDRCGTEHYVIAEENVFQYTGDRRITLGRRNVVLGN